MTSINKTPIGPAVYTQRGWSEDMPKPVVQEDKDSIRAGYMFIGTIALLCIVAVIAAYMIFA